MSEKIIAKHTLSLEVEESEKILLDESDQIISELRQQLSELQEKVKNYETQEQSPISSFSHNELVDQEDYQEKERLKIRLQVRGEQIKSLQKETKETKQKARMLPKFANQVQRPISEMTSNLEQLMSKVQDPGVRDVLAKCKNIALTMGHKSQQVKEQSQQLEQEFTLSKKMVDLLSFLRKVAYQQKEQRQSLTLVFNSTIDTKLSLDEAMFHRAIIVLLQEISHIAKEEVVQISLQQGSETLYDMEIDYVQISLFTNHPFQLVENADIHDFLENVLQESVEHGMNIFHAKKIIEKHGGTLGMYQQENLVTGFEISLPIGSDPFSISK